MNEQNKNNFEPPAMTVLSSTFDQDLVTSSANYSWSIGVIEELN